MVKRFYYVPYYTFSFWTNMIVVCPKCGKAGTVHFDKEKNIAIFQCKSCYMERKTMSGRNAAYEVTAQCTSTGKYFRNSMANNKVCGQKVRVKCPYCEEFVIGDVSDAKKKIMKYAMPNISFLHINTCRYNKFDIE